MKRARQMIRDAGVSLALVWGGLINSFLLIDGIAPQALKPVIVLNHFAHWLLLLSVLVFALAFTLGGRLRLLGWLVPGVVAFGAWYLPGYLPHSTPDGTGREFTAATYNVLGHLADPDRTFAVIRAMDADFVALQELRPTLESKLKTDLSDVYPYQVSKVIQGYDGLALISRYPIVEYEIAFDEVDFSTPGWRDAPKYIRAVIDMDGQLLVAYAVHTMIPLPNIYIRPWYVVPFEYDDSHLQAHVQRIYDLVESETLPVLVLCDCNCTPRTRQHELLDRVLDDAFEESGWGLGLSHPVEPMPVFRIDYVWHTPQFAALDAKVWPDSGTSDHFPVWAWLVLHPA